MGETAIDPAEVAVEEEEVVRMAMHLRANMQGCHPLQRLFVVLTNDTVAHEIERKLQAGEDECNYLTLSMKKGGIEIKIPVVLNTVKTDDRQ